MNILFLTTHAYLPQRVGGSESSTNDLCQLLLAKGDSVAVMASLDLYDRIWLMNRIKAKFTKNLMPSDINIGYPVYRGWNLTKGLESVINEFQPDCVITQAGESIPIIQRLDQLNIKTFVYLRDVAFASHGGSYFKSENIKYIANSQFTAKKFKNTFDISSFVIPPSITSSNYKGKRTPKYVLFVCPFPEKGLEVALKVAEANPDIPFLFLESWKLSEINLQNLKTRLLKIPNITFKHSQKSMLPIYTETKITLMPSQCEEAWGRVASESQVNGIPVIASNIGGLPESVGKGGVLVPPNAEIAIWTEKLRQLWDNDEVYNEYSQLALQHSKRPEIAPSHLVSVLKNYISY